MANEEMKHLVRVMNTDLPGDQPVRLALTGIKGIGRRTANIVVEGSGIDPDTKIGYLSDEEIDTLNSTINNFESHLPSWMLNRQKDPYSGENKHLLGQDIFMSLREDVNTLKKTRAYRGVRLERGLKVRGQRTKSTGRGGSTIGVSKKKS
ncbi:30S ribosomal protein S13 [Methanohalobium sp.]|uniref:30S ribosomal protein S13 n=1 Tax=Methanohalobium sp. TaxID=2837493 RepID=UPI0025F6918B|nr:30S ribosomal protein S13 [Methanohalobium sp.]